MQKSALIFAGVVLLLFGFVAILKSSSEEVSREETGTKATTARQDSVQQFWSQYRQATDHRMAGQKEEAVGAYRTALSFNDTHEDALYYLGNMLMELGAFAEAKAAWEDLLIQNPHSSRAQAQLGNLHFCYASFLDLDAAESAYLEALAINKEETGPLLRLGQVALAQGRLDDAHSYFDEVTGSNYKSVEAYALNGYIAWKQGDADRARTMLALAFRYTQQEKPAEGVLGEGDTKAGMTPLVSNTAGCPLLQPTLDALMQDPERSHSQRFKPLETLLTKTYQGP